MRLVLVLGVLGIVCPATLGFSPVAPSRSLFESRLHGLCSNRHHAFTVLKAEKEENSESLRIGRQPTKMESSGFEPNIRRLRNSFLYASRWMRRQISSISEGILDDMFCDPSHQSSALEHAAENSQEAHKQAERNKVEQNSQLAMIFGVQQQYTRRRLAEFEIRRMHVPGSDEEQPGANSEAETTNPEDQADEGGGEKLLQRIVSSDLSAAAEYLDRHLQGVPDVQREGSINAAAASAAAAAAGSTFISVASATVPFTVADRDASRGRVDAGAADQDSADRAAGAEAVGGARPMIAALRVPPVLLPSADGGGDHYQLP